MGSPLREARHPVVPIGEIFCVMSCSAPCGALTLMHVILALRAGIPPLVPPWQRRRTPPPLTGGSPLREDDGEEGNSTASTVGRVPLTMGFHGLRPLNDGKFYSPRPHCHVHPPKKQQNAAAGRKKRNGCGVNNLPLNFTAPRWRRQEPSFREGRSSRSRLHRRQRRFRA